jgi:thiamine biosynthesis lipoprotein
MRWRRLLAWWLVVSLGVFSVPVSAETMPVVHKKRYAMGTVYEIVAYDWSVARASAAIDQALDEVVRLDAVLSNFKPESDLSRINRSAQFHSVPIPRELYEVIDQSLRYSELSGGLFDISVGPIVDLWKAAIDGGPMPTSDAQERARACVDYRKIELIPPDHIEFHSACMRLDLGSIGKGYAVDRAAAILRSSGVERAYIDAGGSTLYGIGAPPEKAGWRVHLRDPSKALDPQVLLRENSVSTSEQTPPSRLEGDAPGHVVVPATADPLRTRYAVSVIARSATVSDALSTTLLLLGPERGKAIVAGVPDVAAIWIAPDGQKILASSGPHIFLASAGSTNAASAGKDRARDGREW